MLVHGCLRVARMHCKQTVKSLPVSLRQRVVSCSRRQIQRVSTRRWRTQDQKCCRPHTIALVVSNWLMESLGGLHFVAHVTVPFYACCVVFDFVVNCSRSISISITKQAGRQLLTQNPGKQARVPDDPLSARPFGEHATGQNACHTPFGVPVQYLQSPGL